MEDAVDTCLDIGMLADCEVDRTEFYAVYDGHGGVDAVDYVLHNIPKKIVGHDGFADGTVAGMKEAISHGVREVDEELAKLLATRFPPETLADTKTTPGCVGTMVLIRSVQVVIANLGDCRAIWSEDGKMELLTADHRPAVNEAEKARLQAMGVEVSCDGYIHSKLEVCRAWGDFGSQGKLPGLIAEPEVFEKTVTDITEFLVLACDGVFEKLSWEEVGRIARRKLRSGGDPKAAAEAIITMAVKAGTSDNVSCTVVLFKAPPQIERSSSRPWGMSSFKLSEMADTSPPIAEPTGALPAAAL